MFSFASPTATDDPLPLIEKIRADHPTLSANAAVSAALEDMSLLCRYLAVMGVGKKVPSLADC